MQADFASRGQTGTSMAIFTDALVDTGKLVPFLAAIYVVVGFLEYRYGDRISHVLRDLGVF